MCVRLSSAFVVDDIGSIFEEHRICSNINLYQILQTVEGGGVFVSDENKFIFSNVLVGHQAAARFKVANVGRIPCDVVLAVKPVSTKVRTRGWRDQCEAILWWPHQQVGAVYRVSEICGAALCGLDQFRVLDCHSQPCPAVSDHCPC